MLILKSSKCERWKTRDICNISFSQILDLNILRLFRSLPYWMSVILLLLLDIRLMIPFTSVENWFVGGKMGFDGSSLAPHPFFGMVFVQTVPPNSHAMTLHPRHCTAYGGKQQYNMYYFLTIRMFIILLCIRCTISVCTKWLKKIFGNNCPLHRVLTFFMY